jgi:hypothetical protein
MDYLTILLATVAGLGVICLAWLSGYELGENSGIRSERQLAQENKRKPRTRRARK